MAGKQEPGAQDHHCGRVKLVNIDAQNILDGDPKLVLGLMWTLILKYRISPNKADASKNALLEWVNSDVVEHKIKNFSSDRNDGNTLRELINKLEPDFIDMNEANSKPAGDQRIEFGENVAEKMNIPSTIDPKDMAMDEPDELSVMAFISYNRHHETEKPKVLGTRRRRAGGRRRCSARRIPRSAGCPARASRRVRCLSRRRSRSKRRTRRTTTSRRAPVGRQGHGPRGEAGWGRGLGQGQQRRHVHWHV